MNYKSIIYNKIFIIISQIKYMNRFNFQKMYILNGKKYVLAFIMTSDYL